MFIAIEIAAVVLAILTAQDPQPSQPGQSIGHPYSGRLKRPVAFPATSPHHITQSSTRRGRIYFGTDYLVRFLSDTVRRLSETMPGGAALSVGNLSLESGGNIPMSRSHNTGRDVDLGYIVETASGEPAPSYYHSFRKDGRSTEAPKRFRLDLARNWAVFELMMSSSEAELQYFIVAPYIETILIKWAKANGKDPELIRRAEQVMMLPAWAKLHDNHIHARVLCTPEDWAEKCDNGGPVWPWATRMASALEDLRREVVPALASADPAARLAALHTITSRGVGPAVTDVVPLLTDADEKVRAEAENALVALTTEVTAQTVLEAAFTASPKVAARLVAAALPLAGDNGVRTARAVIDGRHPAVTEGVPKKDREKITRFANRLLVSHPIPPDAPSSSPG